MTTNPARPRQPRGIPAGGEYAPYAHAEGTALQGPTILPSLIELTPEAQSIIDALRAAGGRPLVVGGSVRDALLARDSGKPVESKDIDIEVHGLPVEDVAAAIPGEVNLVGKSFGVFTTRINGQDFDISLPRRDSKTGEGHRDFDVELHPDITLEEAFSRRDFTINSMGWDDATGELLDPFNGRADLDARILRHTSDAFDDDPLRVLRGVTFAGRFGMEFAPETAELCRGIAPLYGTLPKERIWKQFHGLAAKGTHISKALQALHDSGWEHHFPGIAATRGVPQEPEWHPEGDVHTHLGMAGDQAAAIARRDGLDEDDTATLVLAAMTHDFGKAHSTVIWSDGRVFAGGHHATGIEPAREFLEQIGAPGEYGKQILPLIDRHMCHTPGGGEEISDSAVRRLLRRLDHANGGPTIQTWARLVEADHAGRGAGARVGRNYLPDWLAIADRLGNERAVSTTLLKGPHLAEAGIPRGPLWAYIVSMSEDAQDDGEFSDEAGVKAWLAANRTKLVATATSRHTKAQEKWKREKAEKLAILQARQREENAARKAAAREAAAP